MKRAEQHPDLNLHYTLTLRSKIEVDPDDSKYILTERGFGYRFG